MRKKFLVPVAADRCRLAPFLYGEAEAIGGHRQLEVWGAGTNRQLGGN